MGDLKDPRLMYLKAWLFLICGAGAAGATLWETRDLAVGRIALLLGIAVWSFCKLYYFLFYVTERYIQNAGDGDAAPMRFAGIGAALRRAIVVHRGGLRAGRSPERQDVDG